jgi:ABC-type bacteriocin/lantibiotic exporter with double-glycine peptidase domain
MFTLENFSITGLKPVSLSIAAGECVGLSGESGSGKTRLLRALADMDEHSGVLALDDISCESVCAHEWRKQVSLLPAESQWWQDRVGEHFCIAHDNAGKACVDDEAVTRLGFSQDVMRWQTSRCSSGEKQRLSLLRLLVNKPRVLLLDEPTANLDPEKTRKVEQLVDDYLARERACCIWVSHSAEQLQRVSSRQFIIADGELQAREAVHG